MSQSTPTKHDGRAVLFGAAELRVLKVVILLLGLNQHTYSRSGQRNTQNAAQFIIVVQIQ